LLRGIVKGFGRAKTQREVDKVRIEVKSNVQVQKVMGGLIKRVIRHVGIRWRMKEDAWFAMKWFLGEFGACEAVAHVNVIVLFDKCLAINFIFVLVLIVAGGQGGWGGGGERR